MLRVPSVRRWGPRGGVLTAAAPPPVDPILATNPFGWWRGDSYVESGGAAVELSGRVGTEGSITLDAFSGGLNPANANANGQPTVYVGDDALCTFDLGASFGFLMGTDFAWFAVFVSPPIDVARVFGWPGAFVVDCPVGGETGCDWIGNTNIGAASPVSPTECVAFAAVAPYDAGPTDAAVFGATSSVPPASNSTYWSFAPPGAIAGLALGGGAGFTGYDLADLILYDRSLAIGGPEWTTINAYLVDRYNVGPL